MEYKTAFGFPDEEPFSRHSGKVVKRSRTVTTTSRNNESSQNIASSPLLEKKTTEITIYENYNLAREVQKLMKQPKSVKDKPLIEVTVTRSDTHQDRREYKTKAKSSVSHLFRSTTARHTKVPNDLRASASTSFTKADKTNHDSIGTVSDLKSVIESLNMNRSKKKTNKKEKNTKKDTIYHQEPEDQGLKCNCSPKQSSVKSGEGARSRVRITGRLGLTEEDDKYVLKCAATIDGQPIDTNFSRSLSPNTSIDKNDRDSITANIGECWPFNCPRLIKREQKNIQAQTEQMKVDLPNTHEAVYSTCRKGSQATQVNLKLLFTNCNNVCSCETADKGIQCGCNVHDLNTDTKYTTDRAATKLPANRSYRNSQSLQAKDDSVFTMVKDIMKPISVKPRATGRSDSPPQDSLSLRRKDKNEEIKARKPRTKSPSPVKKSGDGQSLRRPKSDTNVKAQRSTSPSPIRKSMNRSSTKVASKKPDNKMAKTNIRPKNDMSPDRLTTNSSQRQKPEKKRIASASTNTKTKASSPKTSSKHNKITQLPKQSAKGKKGTLQEPARELTIDRKQANNLLINKFTKNLEPKKNTKKSESKQQDKKLCSCGNNVSNININIEGDSEYYDLLFEKNCHTTGLTVRKKTVSRNEPEPGSDLSLSMENFLMNPEQHRKRSFSKTLVLSGSEGNVDTKPPVRPMTSSMVKVRDSIEIKHIRESRNSGALKSDNKTMNRAGTPPNTNNDFYPVQRSPEIRNPCGAKTKQTKELKAMAPMDSSAMLLAHGNIIRNHLIFPSVTSLRYPKSKKSIHLQYILLNNVVLSMIHIQSENESTNDIIVLYNEKYINQELVDSQEDIHKPEPLPITNCYDGDKEADAITDAKESKERDEYFKIDNIELESLKNDVEEPHVNSSLMDSKEYQIWLNNELHCDKAKKKHDPCSFDTKYEIYSSSSNGDCSGYSRNTKMESCCSVSVNSESGDYFEANSDFVTSQRLGFLSSDHSSEDEVKKSGISTKGNRSFHGLFGLTKKFLTKKN